MINICKNCGYEVLITFDDISGCWAVTCINKSCPHSSYWGEAISDEKELPDWIEEIEEIEG